MYHNIKMKKKKVFLAKMFAILLGCGLVACSDDDNKENAANNPTPDDFNINSAETGVTFDQEAVIRGVSGDNASEMLVSLIYMFNNVKANVTDSTKLLIVPELSSKYEKDITTVYENGGIIGVTNPSQAQISTWFEKVGWDNGFMPSEVDDALMFSFGNGFHCCVVYDPDNDDVAVDSADVANMLDKDSEGFIFKSLLEAQAAVVAEDVANDDGTNRKDTWTDYDSSMYPDVYTYLSAWVETVNKSLSERNVAKAEDTTRVEQFLAQVETRANSGTSNNDVSQLFSKYNYSVVLPFSANEEIRHVALSDPDRIQGEGAVSLNLNIYQIHCYEGAPGAGDYYLINLSAGLASDKMYRGKWVNTHGGVHTRLCGYFAKSFTVDCIPWNKNTNAPYYSDEVETIGAPSPETTVGETVYTTGSSVSLNTTLSLSLGYNLDKDKGYGNGGGTVSAGWSWTDKKSRTISDTDISNLSGYYVINGQPQPICRVGWKMQFNNLPYFQWSQTCGINEGSSQTYRSTNYLESSWVWYKKNVSDGSTENPISVKIRTQSNYGTLSFFTTKADLKEISFNKFGNFDYVFDLKPFSRDKCGVLNIENDFEDGTTITAVRIYYLKNGTLGDLAWSTKNNIVPGKSVSSAALKISEPYMIYLDTNTGKRYIYRKEKGKNIEFGLDNTVYSSIDFNFLSY